MFKMIDCVQGEEEWFQARLGKITASFFNKIMTNSGKKSTSSQEIVNRLVAELIMGEPDETFQSDAMLRGRLIEDEALSFLNFTHGYNFKPCGFMDSLKGYGCSPDADDSENKIGLELKCPMPHTHLEYLSNNELPKKYMAQVQGSLMVSGYKKWIFCSYHPQFPPLVVIVERDEEFINKQKEVIIICCAEVDKKFHDLTKMLGDKS